MTLERKILAGLKDVRHVHFECGQCHARVVLSPKNATSLQYTCPQCKRPWRIESQEKWEQSHEYKLLRAIEFLHDGDADQFSILFEFEEPGR